MSRLTWEWDLLDAQEGPADRPPSPVFTSRFDAEAWLGEHWRELAAGGVAAVRLRHQGAVVAGPLPLRAG